VLSLVVTFEEFAAAIGPRLRAALVGAFGPNVGLDAASEALAYGWEHWERIGAMDNPAGYLYRVGQTAARRAFRPQRFLPVPPTEELPDIEPRLVPALEALTEPQRVCVVMVHAYGWGHTDVAEVLEISPSSVRTHVSRALANLHEALEGTRHGE
jgi:DNA-directed RNA polymerase specialized sigma24 family protein